MTGLEAIMVLILGTILAILPVLAGILGFRLITDFISAACRGYVNW